MHLIDLDLKASLKSENVPVEAERPKSPFAASYTVTQQGTSPVVQSKELPSHEPFASESTAVEEPQEKAVAAIPNGKLVTAEEVVETTEVEAAQITIAVNDVNGVEVRDAIPVYHAFHLTLRNRPLQNRRRSGLHPTQLHGKARDLPCRPRKPTAVFLCLRALWFRRLKKPVLIHSLLVRLLILLSAFLPSEYLR